MAPDNAIITHPKTLQMKRLLYIAAASLMLSGSLYIRSCI